MNLQVEIFLKSRFHCTSSQPLIPTQKVRSTGKLVEKILGRSTEKSYHGSGRKLEVFDWKHR